MIKKHALENIGGFQSKKLSIKRTASQSNSKTAGLRPIESNEYTIVNGYFFRKVITSDISFD